MRITLFEKQFLPLPDHPQITVIKYSHFNRQFINNSSGKFLYIHLYASVACNIYDEIIRAGNLRTDCRRKTISHCAQSSGGQPFSGFIVFIKLCRPHLVLPDFRADYCLAFCKLVYLFNNKFGLDYILVKFICQRSFFLPSAYLLQPRLF